VPIVPDELRGTAHAYPDRVALRVYRADGPVEELTFRLWDQASDGLAHLLVEERGVRPGDRVMLRLPTAEARSFEVAYFAAHKAGAIVVPVNPRYARREVDHIVENCEPKVIVTEPVDVEALARDARPIQAPIDGTDVADILYTSGTTGLPKGVASTHDNVLVNKAAPFEREMRLLQSIPLPTAFGSYGAMLMALRYGLTNIALPDFDARRFGELIESERPAWLLMVPAHILLLIESGVLGAVDGSSVRMVLYGSAPTPTHAVVALAEAFPRAMLCNGYGLTEGGGSACTMPPGEALARPGSVGKPVEGVALRILDDAGDELPVGEIGEVAIRIGGGQREYWNDPVASAETWRDGWVHSGDLGYLDDDGYLYLVDRKKDMIIRGGYNVFSIEVEDALAEHPDVVEVAVLGIPHPILGQDICAVVRLREGATPLELDAARSFVANRLADYKQPRRLVIRSEPLPRSPMQKVDKRALAGELSDLAL
jgi:acyl-CoA synthetase (AMP-forming)/AMP-acid ligase II